MRIFVTGASGYVGSALVKALVQAGHEVGGLVRSDDKMELVKKLGAVPIRGNLRDPETYQHFAASSQAVVHTAFETPAEDQQAVEELVSALQAEGGEKTFVYTSGVWVLGNTGSAGADEKREVKPTAAVAWRPAVEQTVLQKKQGGLNTAVVRPGIVYGGKGGIIGAFFQAASEGGPVRAIGNGTNRWAPIHRDDLAQLYRLVVEKRAGGIFHGVEGSAPTVGEIARACVQAAGKELEVQFVPVEQARQQMGPIADALALDQVVRTHRGSEIGWRPQHRDFLAGASEAWKEWSKA